MPRNPIADLVEAFAGPGVSEGREMTGKFGVLIRDGVGDIEIQRSLDDGATYSVVSRDADGTNAKYSVNNDVAVNAIVEEPLQGVLYRFECTAFTSGPINCRLTRG